MDDRAYEMLKSQSRAILQKSISATLDAKLEQLKDYERHILELGQSFKEMQEDELLKDSAYRKQQIIDLRKEFEDKRICYLSLYANLRVIGELVTVMN